MKIILLIFSLLVLASCGQHAKNVGNSRENGQYQERMELNSEEIALKDKLINKQVMTQKELLKELMSFRPLQQGTLYRLDKHLSIQCLHSSGLCYINEKESK